ncbi:hypothetical protein [Dyella sp. ASV21]|uniref:hypothetical protein n=1 Tax=Dyella sp. ASV21 TaxID=2795114 RepID=UPI0018EA7F1C|nr:hypothetical protein [Dyella sp. ASV21]
MSNDRSKLMPSDIDTYAKYVEGIDPSRYYDSQAQEVWLNAMERWPLLADVLYPDSEPKRGR